MEDQTPNGVVDSISDYVARHSEPAHLQTKIFLPYDKFEELVTEEMVRSAFREAEIPEIKISELMKYIFNTGARRWFFIMCLTFEGVMHNVATFLENLQTNEITDKALPLGFKRVKGWRYHGYSIESPDSARLPDHDSPIFQNFHFSENQYIVFEGHQKKVTAPVFVPGQFQYYFSHIRSLPYMTVDSRPTSGGFFGEVSKVQIHIAHIPAMAKSVRPGNNYIDVAIKKAKVFEQVAEYFDKEVENLKKLRRSENLPHLIKAIAAYQIGQERCLMFPWAEGGNLSEYWKNSESHRKHYQGLIWIIDQFVGICSVFHKLHERNGRHGDLKPENILWFKDEEGYGTLRVADWGLSTFHEEGDNTKMRNDQGKMTRTPPGTDRYTPPEALPENDLKARSRLYDVWSIGCIVVELLVWLVEGFDSVESLRKKTTHFWDEEQNVRFIHHQVNSLLDNFDSRLKKLGKKDTAYGDLLKLVREDLLVMQVPESWESPVDASQRMRTNTEHAHVRMKAIRKKCRREYYLFPLEFQPPLLGRSDVVKKDGLLATSDNARAASTSSGTSGQVTNGGNYSEGESIAVPTNWNHQSINAQNSTMSDTQAYVSTPMPHP
ncbi:heterokaryon incompatibility protein [Pochonia chlamydosporia 170]|uniref:Heterokaryon incompatibility protein n=1 Tax=Pochonia chlamydosporia 170 TaxID=1380566 RepID=A0A179F9A1_METCM|nr:heterokaryon incompatibility protein [Pochonia chlamydosporia 170]OAQ61689.1 heterokaryon incompatibility protein [Pochonia chlamydosporia 170]